MAKKRKALRAPPPPVPSQQKPKKNKKNKFKAPPPPPPEPSPIFVNVPLMEVIMGKLSNRDRNTASLVNKQWYLIDANSRFHLYVSNASAISPERVIARFPYLQSLTLKGGCNPAGIDSEELWVSSFTRLNAILNIDAAEAKPVCLTELRLVRMRVSDDDLNAISNGVQRFRSLRLESCASFTIAGLSSIAINCRMLEELRVKDCDVEDNTGEWLTNFPEDSNSLVRLDVSGVGGNVELNHVEGLLTRSPKLTMFTVNNSLVGGESIERMLTVSSQLQHLGVGSTALDDHSPIQLELEDIRSLKINAFAFSGPAASFEFHSRVFEIIRDNFIELNLRHCVGVGINVAKFIGRCSNLRTLWLSCIERNVLDVICSKCEKIAELRVFDSEGLSLLTEKGLMAIYSGLYHLKTLEYYCIGMKNRALNNFSLKCKKIESFKLKLTMALPNQKALDEGICSIVKNCKYLRKLTVSGRMTGQVFDLIGGIENNLESLYIDIQGSTEDDHEDGIAGLFGCCKKLKTLKINRCQPFQAAKAFGLTDQLRSLTMTNCDLTVKACKLFQNSSLQMKILNAQNDKVKCLCIYRSIAGKESKINMKNVWED